jgi:hypothetical protein
MYTEIAIFRPNSRKREATIESLIPKAAIDVLTERLGKPVADKAQKVINSMRRNDIEMSQLRVDDRRIRIRVTETSQQQ